MASKVYKYRFDESVTGQELEDTLKLAQQAAATVHGRCGSREEPLFNLDKANRICVIDASTDAGEVVAGIFTAFAIREYGEDAVEIERLICENKAP